MVDFSHLRRLPLSSFLIGLEDSGPLSDEFFDHLLDRIEPPLFESERMKALRAELCWFAPRAQKGRPRKGCRRLELATAVLACDRPDIPRALLEVIQRRLSEPPASDRLQAPRSALRRRQKANNLSLLRGIYANLIDVAFNDKEAIHPMLAEKANLLHGSKRPRQDALEITKAFLHGHLGLQPPSLRRMRNMI